MNEDDVFIDIGEELIIASDADALIDRVAAKLLAGEISEPLREEISGMLALLVGPDSETWRVAETIYLIVTSPEFALQR